MNIIKLLKLSTFHFRLLSPAACTPWWPSPSSATSTYASMPTTVSGLSLKFWRFAKYLEFGLWLPWGKCMDLNLAKVATNNLVFIPTPQDRVFFLIQSWKKPCHLLLKISALISFHHNMQFIWTSNIYRYAPYASACVCWVFPYFLNKPLYQRFCYLIHHGHSFTTFQHVM